MTFEEIKNISIVDFLNGIGVPCKKHGKLWMASSPFASDSNWSFCIYPTNTYYDWSTGHGGNIINLVCRLYNCSKSDAIYILKTNSNYEKYQPNYKQHKSGPTTAEFNYEKYVNKNKDEIQQIKEYAASRKITEGYCPGVFLTHSAEKNLWERHPALGFVHVDENLKPCGIKLRSILPNDNPRFSARGKISWYMIPPLISTVGFQNPAVYVVEGEANANSLSHIIAQISLKAYVLSSGGVGVCPRFIPKNLEKLPVKLIIDYDGNEELYQQRLKLYEHLKAEPIKLILPKGEDINSIYAQGKEYLIENLL